MEERGNPIDALRGRGEQTILWEARISERIADNNNRRFCFCYRKQPQTLKKLNILLLASAWLPYQQTLLFAEREIFIQWETEIGGITVVYCSAVY